MLPICADLFNKLFEGIQKMIPWTRRKVREPELIQADFREGRWGGRCVAGFFFGSPELLHLLKEKPPPPTRWGALKPLLEGFKDLRHLSFNF